MSRQIQGHHATQRVPEDDNWRPDDLVDELEGVVTVGFSLIASLGAARHAVSAEVERINVVIRRQGRDDLDEFLPALRNAVQEQEWGSGGRSFDVIQRDSTNLERLLGEHRSY